MARWASAKRARNRVAGTVHYGVNTLNQLGLAFGSRRKEPPLTFLTYQQSITALSVVQSGPGCRSDSPLAPPEPWLRSVDDECKHGRLPGDRTPPCGCF